MKTKLFFIKSILLAISMNMINHNYLSQSTPFNCDYSAYLFQFNDVYALDLASGSSYLVDTNIVQGTINATGYNPIDGYIWGFLSTPASTIVRIGKNFNVETFTISQLPASGNYIGDVDSLGNYFLKGAGTSFHKINLDSNSVNYTKYERLDTLSQNISIHDWAFNSVDGFLYTVEKRTNHLYRINSNTGLVIDLGEVPVLQGLSYTYGAVYFDSEGRFYVSANETGTIYIIYAVQSINYGDTINSNYFAYGPSSRSNDGARCPTAPVPQEDCMNGVDDDGDGLIDCNDPACSGVAACPIISPPVSGGNSGGLESNDRLSTQINQRNYLRSKANYSFNKEKAPQIIKSASYKQQKVSRSGFVLKDLIPLEVIDGTTAIESSPSDLITITNATDLFSVDYVKAGETVAAILATKTENGVYEHTKYICDRLLGAELLSVSTILIKDKKFIKSIIKNVDGSIEFVLSLSGRVVNNGDNFAIESHWNIDKYEQNATFYNFQIWSNSIDDLLILGEEVLELFEAQKPIVTYNNSNPPPVFVKKGKYSNGALELEIINTSSCKKIWFDAGFKRTETSETENSSYEIELAAGYLTSIVIETGYLFDIGFRIRNDRNETSDDLFMSDGPWGLDNSSEGTSVETYLIEKNESMYYGEGMRVERNVRLEAFTDKYVAVYKAFNPKFNSIDLSEFNTLSFEANGTGEMEITIIKSGITGWENQYRTTVNLTNEDKQYELPYRLFTSINGGKMDLSDAVSIVFTLSANGLETEKKVLNLNTIEFSHKEELAQKENEILIVPNPMNLNATVCFFSMEETPCTIQVFNMAGAIVFSYETMTKLGNNKIKLNKGSLTPGVYVLAVKGGATAYKPIKLVVN